LTLLPSVSSPPRGCRRARAAVNGGAAYRDRRCQMKELGYRDYTCNVNMRATRCVSAAEAARGLGRRREAEQPSKAGERAQDGTREVMCVRARAPRLAWARRNARRGSPRGGGCSPVVSCDTTFSLQVCLLSNLEHADPEATRLSGERERAAGGAMRRPPMEEEFFDLLLRFSQIDPLCPPKGSILVFRGSAAFCAVLKRACRRWRPAAPEPSLSAAHLPPPPPKPQPPTATMHRTNQIAQHVIASAVSTTDIHTGKRASF
jgi:hypothetical protein